MIRMQVSHKDCIQLSDAMPSGGEVTWIDQYSSVGDIKQYGCVAQMSDFHGYFPSLLMTKSKAMVYPWVPKPTNTPVAKSERKECRLNSSRA